VNESFGASLDATEFERLTSDLGWSLDSWIQASANQFRNENRNPDEFYDLLTETLYGDLLRAARGHGLDTHLAIALQNPRSVPKRETIQLAEFFEDVYRGSSLLAMARVLMDCIETSMLPRAVITFNADTLLHTLVELLQRRDHYAGTPPHSHPKYYFTSILRSLGNLPQHTVPIFHIHGAIKPDVTVHVAKGHDARDKLIFLEEDFLRVATSASSWPEVTFMFHSQVSRLVFVGLSMSDSNIRRWLSSSHSALTKEVQTVAGVESFEPVHIWVTAKPADRVKAQSQSVGLSHLGVGTAWLPNWQLIGDGLRNLLAIPISGNASKPRLAPPS
jgi:hypothetical protein